MKIARFVFILLLTFSNLFAADPLSAIVSLAERKLISSLQEDIRYGYHPLVLGEIMEKLCDDSVPDAFKDEVLRILEPYWKEWDLDREFVAVAQSNAKKNSAHPSPASQKLENHVRDVHLYTTNDIGLDGFTKSLLADERDGCYPQSLVNIANALQSENTPKKWQEQTIGILHRNWQEWNLDEDFYIKEALEFCKHKGLNPNSVEIKLPENTISSVIATKAETVPKQVIQECSICFDDLPKTDFIKLSCGHEFCRACLDSLLANAITNKSTALLCCAKTTCKAKLETSDIKKIDSNGLVKYRAINDILLQEHLSAEKRAKQCPTPNCTNRFIWEGSQRTAIKCAACSMKYCSDCLVNHEMIKDMTCEQIIQQSKNLNESEKWIKRNTKQCPSCENKGRIVPIEKNQGCKFVRCTQCQEIFCFKCRAISNHKPHMEKGTNKQCLPFMFWNQ